MQKKILMRWRFKARCKQGVGSQAVRCILPGYYGKGYTSLHCRISFLSIDKARMV